MICRIICFCTYKPVGFHSYSQLLPIYPNKAMDGSVSYFHFCISNLEVEQTDALPS